MRNHFLKLGRALREWLKGQREKGNWEDNFFGIGSSLQVSKQISILSFLQGILSFFEILGKEKFPVLQLLGGTVARSRKY